jgi:hypothetical protein
MSERHPIFAAWPMPELNPTDFDSNVLRDSDDWVGVFLWGHDCPNCEIAKRVLLDRLDEFRAFPIQWFHVNTYHHAELGTRFGLHGIPTFLFFRQGRLKGRATSFPGGDQFLAILKKLTTD